MSTWYMDDGPPSYWVGVRDVMLATDMGTDTVQRGGILWRLTVHFVNADSIFREASVNQRMNYKLPNRGVGKAYITTRFVYPDEEQFIVGACRLQQGSKYG